MQRKNILIGAFLGVIMITASCSKNDSDSDPAPKTKTELLSKAAWKFSDAKVAGISVAMMLEACEKDNLITFAASGSGTADEGASKCDPSDPQSNPFTWSFQNSETVLFVSTPLFTGGSSTFNIVSLTETQLVATQNITIGANTQNAEITLVH